MYFYLFVYQRNVSKSHTHTHGIYGYVPWYLSPFYKGTQETDLLLDVFCLWIYLLNIYFHVVNSRSDQEIATVTLIRIELFTTVSQCSASSMTFSSSFDLIYLNIQLCLVVCRSTSWMNSIQAVFFFFSLFHYGLMSVALICFLFIFFNILYPKRPCQ